MSDSCNDCVVLFKAVSDSENESDDNYYSTFHAAGFQVKIIPVLDFKFLNLDELLIKLQKPDEYEGIIFSSPRCVTAIELAVGKSEASVLEKWQKHRHFVVGQRTAVMAEKLKFVVDGREAGNAKNLAKIMSRGQYEKPFLYPKGSLTKDSFKILLKEYHIEVDDCMVYKTQPHPALETNIEAIKALFLVKAVYCIYFSPSGVNFTLPLLQKHKFELNQTKFVAIGPATEAALEENGLNVSAVAVEPEPQSLLDAVLKSKIVRDSNTSVQTALR